MKDTQTDPTWVGLWLGLCVVAGLTIGGSLALGIDLLDVASQALDVASQALGVALQGLDILV